MHCARLLLVPCATVLAATPLFAGDYHDRGTLNCSECHVMHPSKAKRPELPLSARASRGFEAQRQDVGPLLKQEVNELCLSCHDDRSSAPDVLGANRGEAPQAIREAGSLNAPGVGSPGTGHTLGTLDFAPGSSPRWNSERESGAGIGLNCLHCHTHHGRQDETSAYRNLRSDAGNNRLGQGLVTYNDASIGANDLTRDVFERRSHDYDESAVDFNEPDPRDSAMARFCAGCHGDFHGAPGTSSSIGGERHGASYTNFLRHPAAGVDIGAVGGEHSSARRFASHSSRVKVLSSSGAWATPGDDATPTCITCHKAHGNGNAFGLIYRSGRGTPTENGDTSGRELESLCAQCHEQAAAFSDP